MDSPQTERGTTSRERLDGGGDTWVKHLVAEPKFRWLQRDQTGGGTRDKSTQRNRSDQCVCVGQDRIGFIRIYPGVVIEHRRGDHHRVCLWSPVPREQRSSNPVLWNCRFVAVCVNRRRRLYYWWIRVDNHIIGAWLASDWKLPVGHSFQDISGCGAA